MRKYTRDEMEQIITKMARFPLRQEMRKRMARVRSQELWTPQELEAYYCDSMGSELIHHFEDVSDLFLDEESIVEPTNSDIVANCMEINIEIGVMAPFESFSAAFTAGREPFKHEGRDYLWHHHIFDLLKAESPLMEFARRVWADEDSTDSTDPKEG